MAGIAYLAAFELCGVMVSFGLSRRRAAIKIWMGLVVGLMEMMWLPSLFAFLFDFTLTAHIFALATAFVSGALCLGLGLKKAARVKQTEAAPQKRGTLPPLWLSLLLLVPLCALAAYLHYTHTFREIDGALYSGQSTYGDLCMHAGFVTGLIGQSYPPEYTILPGTRLGYPFLVDALSASMYLFGLPLSLSIVIPGALMTALIFTGFLLFSWEVTRSKAAAAIALICLVLSGGLGFLYYFDLNGTLAHVDLTNAAFRSEVQRTLHLGNTKEVMYYNAREPYAAIENALGSYYNAPANFPLLNLRWVNALCDLIIPQRTLMAGWLCLIPALYLLYTALKKPQKRDFILLGCFAGPMVMIHTHSFLGLGVISLGAMLDSLLRFKEKRTERLKCFLLYGVISVVIALPQLLVWTFPQTFKGGSLKLLFNWVNNNGDDTFKDNYLWFWLKNVGPMFLLMPLGALTSRKKGVKALSLGALFTFVLAEIVVFQPNVYDNNKLFWTAYLCMLPVGAGYLVKVLGEHRHLLTRICAWVLIVVLLTASGAISVAREVISGLTPRPVTASQSGQDEEENESLYSAFGTLSAFRALLEQDGKQHALRLFEKHHVQAAEFIKAHTFEDALFLTSTNHNNTVSVLTGRRIVCGSNLYLYYHGVDYPDNERDVRLMLSDPAGQADLFKEYGVDYVFLSNYEKNEAGAQYTDFDALYPLIYRSGDEYWYDPIRIYAVSERARVKFQEEGAQVLQ